MAGGADKEGRRVGRGRSSEQLRDVQRYASLLQKAINSRRAARRDMGEVDTYLNEQFTPKIADTLDKVESILNRPGPRGEKRRLSRIHSSLLGIFEGLASLEKYGYSRLIQPDGSVDPSRLSGLIDIDTELSTCTAAIQGSVGRMRKLSGSNSDYEELEDIIANMEALLQKRKELTEEGRWPI